MKIGVIGGSGLYALDGITNLEEVAVDTPFGAPSDNLIKGTLDGLDLVFLPRHGKGHRLLPGELNHRANIFAMKVQGVEAIISLSAVGSFREELAPGDMVLVDQFVDRTKRSADQTFFGNGIAAHVSLARPTCEVLRSTLHQVISKMLTDDNPNGISVHLGGTYLNMEGPGFSTLAESNLYRSWNMDVIGMTNFAEAKLAREAEICYQTIAMVTDYDCWHEEFGAVTVEQIIKTLMQNASFGKELIRRAVPAINQSHPCECCGSALGMAIITSPDVIPEETKKSLAPIIGKYIS